MENVEVNEQRTSATLSIAKSLYSKGAVLRACYWLERDLWFQLNERADIWIIVLSLRTHAPTLDQPRVKNIDDWLPGFFSSLLDYQLRVDIQTETAPVRELILAKAFAESGVLEDAPPGAFQDPVDSIAISRDKFVTISNKVSG